ncbi:hypothetical protein HETIRDRAFT_174685 [Heterobasidion irregulare TC 32-1]|uniref:Hydrophobin n=1 Tax=Heterobasidion irregulare (strain TC 32-1) TaxID=747525 RepID=W4JSU8_HETIT|nr:uncharacterized protein HETIRDRAFT_174685 [Heterobasidion irregulare TC 32-1]ETW76637.1 hypothetical protein HETIRDRAFT_174685 [Heterobasidion irregulare TC 32-1]
MFSRISALSVFSVLALAIAGSATSLVSRQAAACPAGKTALCCLTYVSMNIRTDSGRGLLIDL